MINEVAKRISNQLTHGTVETGGDDRIRIKDGKQEVTWIRYTEPNWQLPTQDIVPVNEAVAYVIQQTNRHFGIRRAKWDRPVVDIAANEYIKPNGQRFRTVRTDNRSSE